jgi:hypothetical protein
MRQTIPSSELAMTYRRRSDNARRRGLHTPGLEAAAAGSERLPEARWCTIAISSGAAGGAMFVSDDGQVAMCIATGKGTAGG